ncbi:MAG: LytTR family DNA-binding domain-containing protein [Oscillospiraceae bacterium]|nr:LytTR family DNA-binding domain-containing protein [Oscillospiraceae bacterium]
MIYKIAICDDEKIELKYLSSLLSDWAVKTGNLASVSAFESAEAFLFDYAEHKDYDILLLDIEMNKINGIELAKKVRADNLSVQIIFITGFPDFISEGYEVAALHYLMKPVSSDKLFEVLDRACQHLCKEKRAVLFNTDGEIIRVFADEIIFSEAFAHSVMINKTDGSCEVKMSISEAEKLLGDGFIRCHRSYIVGLKYVKRITKTDVILDNGKMLPLSRNAYNSVNQAFIDFYKRIIN